MICVTFDSNVWRIVASPEKFQNEKSIDDFTKINSDIKNGKISAALSETVFTLEGIKKTGRQAFLASYAPDIPVQTTDSGNGVVGTSISISPNITSHPGNNSYLSSHLTDALSLGFKIFHCPRIAGVVNPDLDDSIFIPISHEIANRFGDCGRQIEAAGCGMAKIQAIGNKYTTGKHIPWFDGIKFAPLTEENAIAKAVAEWADGDAVAAHYAYGYDYICTRDSAKGAGEDSVFSVKNRAWLEANYGVKFVTPEELAKLV